MALTSGPYRAPNDSWTPPLRPYPRDPGHWSSEAPRRSVRVEVESTRSPDRSLASLLNDFDARWERGERPRAEDYLSEIDADTAIELIFHEYCQAEASGEAPSVAGFVERFPAYRGRLARLFGLKEVLEGNDPEVLAGLPEVGDEIGPYRLLRELGRGSFARVFLAEQADLEHRLVVVKVSGRCSPEPLLLARAQHPHIVGVLRHVETEGGALSLVCMPFLGGATLAAVFAERGRLGRRVRSGRDLLALLDRVAEPEYTPATSRGPARELLATLPLTRAVAWLVARLAEALDHAHRRGVSHGDVKPSNVLWTADGQPMLLDFNLALDWSAVDRGRSGSGDPGGTLAYMAPERLRALAQPGRVVRPDPLARHRADLYALGLVLAEALGASLPAVAQTGRANPREYAAKLAESRGEAFLRRILREIPPALRPIVARCLAADPADRYSRAAELAEDLDRFRHDLPLAFAPVPGRLTRLVRWARRRGRPLVVALLVLVGGASVAAVVSWHDRMRLRDVATAKLDMLLDGTEPGVFHLRRIGVPHAADPSGLTASSGALRHLSRYDVLGKRDWRQRDDVRFLSESDRDDLTAWMMEQAWRYAAAVVDRPDAHDDWRRARAALANVSVPSRLPQALAILDGRLHERLREPTAISEEPVVTTGCPAWVDEYLQGVALERDRPGESLDHYRAALAARPDSFWVRYRLAAAGWKAQDRELSAEAMRLCVARRPGNPRLRIILAGLYYYLGRPDLAQEQIQAAVTLDPESAEAYRTLAFARKGLGQREQTELDLARFRHLERALGDRSSWTAIQDSRILLGPPAERMSDLPAREVDRLRAAAATDLEARLFLACCLEDAGRGGEALEQLASVLDAQPGHLAALHAYAKLLHKRGHPEAATALRRLIDHPRFVELLVDDDQVLHVYRYLASNLLQGGRIEEARDVLQRGIEQLDALIAEQGKVGSVLARLRGEFHYSSARIEAVQARQTPSSLGAGLSHLRLARKELPAEVDRWYRADAVFDPLRAELDTALAEARDNEP